MRRGYSFAVVAVAVLAVMAGCSSVSDGTATPAPTADETPAPTDDGTPAATADGTPTDGTPTATPTDDTPTGQTPDDATPTPDSPDDLAPVQEADWTEASSLNQTALLVGHARTLRGASYTIEANYTTVIENGSVETQVITDRIDDAAYTRTRTYEVWREGKSFTTEQFRNDSYVGSASIAPNGTIVSAQSGTPSRELDTYRRFVPLADITFGFATKVNWTADGRTTRDGRAVYRYRGTGFRPSAISTPNASFESATMYVDQRGRIQAVEMNYGAPYSLRLDDPVPATRTVVIELSNVNQTAVETPEWVAES